MSHKFIQFKDFEYLIDGKLASTNIKVIVYVKVVDKGKKYLGSLKFGLYYDVTDEDLEEYIIDIISQNYPDYGTYTPVITKLGLK